MWNHASKWTPGLNHAVTEKNGSCKPRSRANGNKITKQTLQVAQICDIDVEVNYFQIAKVIGLTLITYRSDAEMSDRCLNDGGPMGWWRITSWKRSQGNA